MVETVNDTVCDIVPSVICNCFAMFGFADIVEFAKISASRLRHRRLRRMLPKARFVSIRL